MHGPFRAAVGRSPIHNLCRHGTEMDGHAPGRFRLVGFGSICRNTETAGYA